MATKTSKTQGGKTTAKSTEGKKPNALQKQLQPSKELATVVGAEPGLTHEIRGLNLAC